MIRLRSTFLLIAVALGGGAACATGLIDTEDASTNDGGGSDATTTKDVIATDAPLADGATCTAPLTKCIADAGAFCVDTKTDPGHCGACTNKCTTADAGSLAPGPNNPDAGVPFDGGYDGGIGWTLGTPGCDGGACAVTCPQGFDECSDGICYDPQNFHDHCGNCTTACATTEWCTQGHCCSQGTELCNGTCTDVLGDKNNCGACGKVCGGGTPVCSNGVCSTATVFSQSFVTSQIATSQCTVWTSYRASLTGTYTSITLSGSNDTTGRTCTGAGANTLCQALHTGTATNVTCNGNTWYVDDCSGIELTADGAACSCKTPGYAARPCLYENGDWGGVNTATCGAPSQTITVSCQ